MTLAGDPLAGIDLVVFDKDGTLIEFHAMWSGWTEALGDALSDAVGRDVRGPLFAMLEYDPTTRRARSGGLLAATPMARLREHTGALLRDEGFGADAAEQALAVAWHAPDPVTTARAVTDLASLLTGIRANGTRVAVITADDRDPTERTLAALGIDGFMDAVVCADDGLPVKPRADAVLAVCARLGVPPGRTAVVGDAVADLRMGRAAGAARCYGVRTGVDDPAHLAPYADSVFDSVADLLPAGPA